MELKDYISNREGEEANRLERQSMNDPFLRDAIDGFDSVEGNHLSAIRKLEEQIEGKKEKKSIKPGPWIWIVALIIALLAASPFLWKTIRQTLENIGQKNSNQNLSINENIPVSRDSALHADHFVNKELNLRNDSLPSKKEKPASSSIPEKSNEKNAISTSPTLIPEKSEQSNNAETSQQEKTLNSATMNQTNESTNPSGFQENKTQIANAASTFGENEFISYFKRNYNRSLCEGQAISFVVSFYVGPSGHPGNINISQNNCPEMATEIKRLLLGSPIWSKTDRRVTLKIDL